MQRRAARDHAPTTGLRWDGRALHLLDQTELPARERWLRCDTVEDVARAIERLAVRGAPAIAAAAAYGLVLAIDEDGAGTSGSLAERVEAAAGRLLATRPTAVNLARAVAGGRRALRAAAAAGERTPEQALRDWADGVIANQSARDDALIANALGLFGPGCRALTHCNTGRLATAARGTALGALEAAARSGLLAHVWVTETRPLLQGSRLTAWELRRAGVAHTLITDGSVGEVMRQGLVDAVIVGADRVAANGDVANKIGTYAIAVLARHHGIPFYVAAPHTTLDPSTATGAEIPLEQRAAGEVTTFRGSPVAPDDTPVLNLAFDVTPAELVNAIVTDRGLLRPPYRESVGAAAQATAPGTSSPPRPPALTASAVDGLAAAGRAFHARGWLPGTGGNLSVVVRRSPLALAVTATGADKGALTAADIAVVDDAGQPRPGDPQPSAEVALHLAIVRAIPGTGAVLHTHSLAATEASLRAGAAVELSGFEQLKALAGCGDPDRGVRLPILDNDQDLPRLAERCRAVLAARPAPAGLLLRGHGLYAWGRDLAAARRHVESIEHLLELLTRTGLHRLEAPPHGALARS